MAKKAPARGRGRPAAANPLDIRVLVRLDQATKRALDRFAQKSGAAENSTAIRIILVERLRGEGLL